MTYELQRAESGRELTRMSLCHLIGLELDAQIIATDTLILTQNYNNQLSHDIVNRPEYRIQEMQVELKDLEIKNTRADFLPTVGISAGYSIYGGHEISRFISRYENTDGNGQYKHSYIQFRGRT